MYFEEFQQFRTNSKYPSKIIEMYDSFNCYHIWRNHKRVKDGWRIYLIKYLYTCYDGFYCTSQRWAKNESHAIEQFNEYLNNKIKNANDEIVNAKEIKALYRLVITKDTNYNKYKPYKREFKLIKRF